MRKVDVGLQLVAENLIHLLLERNQLVPLMSKTALQVVLRKATLHSTSESRNGLERSNF